MRRRGGVGVGRPRAGAATLFGAIAGVGAAAGTASAALPEYGLVGSFDLPAGTASYDVLPDGRAMAVVGSSIWTQDSVGGSGFSLAGSVPAGVISPFGASFLRVSPSGTRIAVGDNEFGAGAEVFVLEAAALGPGGPSTGVRYPIDNFDAHWSDDDTLWVSGGSLTDTLVTRLDAAGQSFGAVVGGIGGASGGVSTDGTHLYTANGFSFGGPSATGDIRAFALGSLTPGAAVNFETDGVLVASVLSGNTLGFDALGNLLVGGGPGGFAAVVDGDQVRAAALGAGVASSLLQLSPTTEDSHFIRHNPATGELLITTFGGPTVYRYAVVPSPVGLAILLPGVLARRRRRGE